MLTRLLWYISCYSGGEHLVKPYETVSGFPAVEPGGLTREATRANIFNYTIVTANLFQTVTTSYGIGARISGSGHSISIIYPIDFSQFFDIAQRYSTGGKTAPTIEKVIDLLARSPIEQERLYLDQSLDAYMGNTKDAWYKTPLYVDQDKKLYIKKGSTLIYRDLSTMTYFNNNDVYVDSKKGSPLGSYFLINNDQLSMNGIQQSYLVIEKDTVFVYQNKATNKHYFTTESPQLSAAQIPAVRFPGTGWFSAVDLHNKIERITRIDALTAQANNKPIVIQGKLTILCDTQSPLRVKRSETVEHAALGTLEIKKKSKENAPQLMLIAAKDACMYVQQIKTEYNKLETLRSCIPLNYYAYARTIYIKKLICSDGILDDVIILCSAPLPGVGQSSLQYNGVLYTQQGKQQAGYWSVHDEQKYTTFMEGNNIPELKQATYKFAYPYPDDLTEYKQFAALAKVVEEKHKKGSGEEESPQQQQPVQQPVQQPKQVTPPTKDPLAEKLKALEQSLQQLRTALQGKV